MYPIHSLFCSWTNTSCHTKYFDITFSCVLLREKYRGHTEFLYVFFNSKVIDMWIKCKKRDHIFSHFIPHLDFFVKKSYFLVCFYQPTTERERWRSKRIFRFFLEFHSQGYCHILFLILITDFCFLKGHIFLYAATSQLLREKVGGQRGFWEQGTFIKRPLPIALLYNVLTSEHPLCVKNRRTHQRALS